MTTRWWNWLLVALFAPAMLMAQSAGTLLQLGRPTASSGFAFEQIEDVRELADGRLIVLDRRNADRHLSVVDFAAGSIHPIGRRGAGPGEYTRPRALQPLEGDASLVTDEALFRWLILTGARTDRVIPADAAVVRSLGFAPRGSDGGGRVLAIRGTRFVAPVPNIAHAESLMVLVADPSRGTIDTVARLPGAAAKLHQFRFADTLGTILAANPLRVWPQPVLLTGGAIAVVHPAPYRVEILGRSGSSTKGPELDSPARAPSEAEKRAAIVWRWPGVTLAKTLPTSTFDDWPGSTPAFLDGGVSATATGCIVVRRFGTRTEAVSTLDVLSSRGARIAQYSLPAGESLVRVSRMGVYVSRADQDGLLSIVRYPPLRVSC